MDKYIDVEDFSQMVYENFGRDGEYDYRDLIRILREQPTADVKEVVYCKNCNLLNDKYAKQGETDSDGNPQYYCNHTGKTIKLDDYCSGAELKETIKNLNNNQTLKIDKFAILLNEMDIKSYEISILQEGLKILSKYNDEITYREIIILLRYGSILFPNSCYDNDLKEEIEQVLKGGSDDE